VISNSTANKGEQVAANGQVVKFQKSGGDVFIELTVGQMQWGRFRAFIWDADGSNEQSVGNGLSNDSIPDIWKLPARGKSLDKRIVSWEVLIGSLDTGTKPPLYSVSARFSQDGSPLPAGVFIDAGDFVNGKIVSDFVVMEAV
jgi:hypothetical protein